MSSTHDAHDAHAFTGEPVNELPPDEPRTPGWLPLLGIALFTAAVVVVLAGRASNANPDGTGKPDEAAHAAAPAAPPVAQAPAVVAAKRGPEAVRPAGQPGDPMRRVLPQPQPNPAAPHH